MGAAAAARRSSEPKSRAPGLAYIGWKAARFAVFFAMLPLVPVRLFVVVLAPVSLALSGLGQFLYAAMEYANAPRRFLTKEMNKRAEDIRAIRRREGLTMRN